MKIGDAVQYPLILQDKISDEEVSENLRKSRYSKIFLVLSFFILLITYLSTFFLTTFLGIISLFVGGLIFVSAFLSYYWYTIKQKHSKKDPDVLELLEKVGLSPAVQYYDKYPHELSGGERQRANIARSIILNPDLLILDEPTSMLDVSLRAGILNLLKSIQEEYNIAILFITHDLATALHFSDRIGIMYVGEIVEKGTTDAIFNKPAHPYTEALIEAIPSLSTRDTMIELPTGNVPSSIDPPSACRFHPRCKYAEDICSQEKPILRKIGPDREVACHFQLLGEE